MSWVRTWGMRPRPAGHRDAPSPGELAIQTRPSGDAIVIEVIGRITIDSSPQLRAVLHRAIAAASGDVVVDGGRVSYIDTSAIATLIEAATLAQGRGVRLRLVGIAGAPRQLADVTELDRIFRSLGSEVEVP